MSMALSSIATEFDKERETPLSFYRLRRHGSKREKEYRQEGRETRSRVDGRNDVRSI
jgi:hypothetical protein